jgi:hypothetical protein
VSPAAPRPAQGCTWFGNCGIWSFGETSPRSLLHEVSKRATLRTCHGPRLVAPPRSPPSARAIAVSACSPAPLQIGHNFGLYHSWSWPDLNQYGDTAAIMGASRGGAAV